MSVNVHHKRRNALTGQSLDLSGLGYSHLWAFIKSSEATMDYAMKVRRGTGNVERYIFWDSKNEATPNSKVSTTTTPTSTTAQEFADVSPTTNLRTHVWYDQIGGVGLSEPFTDGPLFYSGSSESFITKNSKPAIQFLGGTNQYLKRSTELSELDPGEDCSVSIVANTSSSILNFLFETSEVSANRFLGYLDGSTSNFIARIKASSTNYDLNYTSQVSGTEQRHIVITREGTETKAYHNGVLQETLTISGTYVNDALWLGAIFNNATRLVGKVQLFGVHNITMSQANVTDEYNRFNKYYKF